MVMKKDDEYYRYTLPSIIAYYLFFKIILIFTRFFLISVFFEMIKFHDE